MKKLAIVASIVCVFLLTVAFSQSATLNAQQPTLNPSELTATHIISMATQTRIALGTPLPRAQIAETLTVVAPTRTAIALTREPSLAVSLTPNNIQLTATVVVAEATQTQSAALSNSETAQSFYETATAIANRFLEPTLIWTSTPGPCRLSVGNYLQSDLTRQLQRALDQTLIPEIHVHVITVSVGEGAGCASNLYPLRTLFRLVVDVKDIRDDDVLADLTATTLSVLVNFPPQEEFGPEPARLVIIFAGNYQRRYLDTGYTNALAAFEEGLRRAELIEALGGIVRFSDI